MTACEINILLSAKSLTAFCNNFFFFDNFSVFLTAYILVYYILESSERCVHEEQNCYARV